MKPRFALALLSLWFLIACQVAFGDFTIDTSHLSVSCESFTTRCDGGNVQSCVNGNEWDTINRCPSADSCNLLTLDCSACNAGAYQCNGAQPQVCGANGHWNPPTAAACASATLCIVPEDGTAAYCQPPGCDSSKGQFQCTADNHLQRCPITLEGWQDVEICATGQCDVAHATAQVNAGKPATCNVPSPACAPNCACTPGAFQCNESALERCRSDGTTWDLVEQCQNQVLCNPNEVRCEAPRCMKGDNRCQVNTQQACRVDLSGWDNVVQCDASSYCDPLKGCIKGKCTEGAYRCNDVYLETCTAGSWANKDTCAASNLCDAKQKVCNAPLCAVGARQCSGDVLQRCNATRDGWDEFQCTNGETCNPSTTQCEQPSAQ